MYKNQQEVEKASHDVLEGKIPHDCAHAMLHINNCERCRDEIIENGEPLNRKQ